MIRTIKTTFTIFASTFITLFLLQGCVKRQLELRPQRDGDVEIALDWKGESYSNITRYLFYDEAGKFVKEITGVTESFKYRLPAGKYRVIVHNTDARNVDYRGTNNFETAEIFAQKDNTIRNTISKSSSPMILEPKQVYGVANFNEFEVLEVTSGGTHKATMTPTTLSSQVRFLFNVEAGISLKSLTGTLNGVASGKILSTGKTSSTVANGVAFVAGPTQRSDSYNTTLNVFGFVLESSNPDGAVNIAIKATEASGTELDAVFDLTQVIKQLISENNGELPIDIPIEFNIKLNEIGALTSTVGIWEQGSVGNEDVD